mmetsp:Transcript_71560/g.141931  ORF Transcript_71560/g.141931 Transcript_71560/m.141931 type:complete len:221 (+) Transcript_71560:157-819(+)
MLSWQLSCCRHDKQLLDMRLWRKLHNLLLHKQLLQRKPKCHGRNWQRMVCQGCRQAYRLVQGVRLVCILHRCKAILLLHPAWQGLSPRRMCFQVGADSQTISITLRSSFPQYWRQQKTRQHLPFHRAGSHLVLKVPMCTEGNRLHSRQTHPMKGAAEVRHRKTHRGVMLGHHRVRRSPVKHLREGQRLPLQQQRQHRTWKSKDVTCTRSQTIPVGFANVI